MELGALVALRLTALVFGLAGAELAEILRRPRDYVLEELEGNAAEGFTWTISDSQCNCLSNIDHIISVLK